jgi:hypothetical protein
MNERGGIAQSFPLKCATAHSMYCAGCVRLHICPTCTLVDRFVYQACKIKSTVPKSTGFRPTNISDSRPFGHHEAPLGRIFEYLAHLFGRQVFDIQGIYAAEAKVQTECCP